MTGCRGNRGRPSDVPALTAPAVSVVPAAARTRRGDAHGGGGGSGHQQGRGTTPSGPSGPSGPSPDIRI
ncbi:hypothetical protein [Streptomyces luteireticuli]|uniref:hypothetical protein n=1 Tax=Streptomyces luteireticuli TaxID=173858 RepID=UPI0035577565